MKFVIIAFEELPDEILTSFSEIASKGSGKGISFVDNEIDNMTESEIDELLSVARASVHGHMIRLSVLRTKRGK